MKDTFKVPHLRGTVRVRLEKWGHRILLPLAIAALAGCGKTQPAHTAAQPDLPAIQVRTQTVETKPLAAVEEVVGTVRARLHATLEAKTTGRITDLPVTPGQKIKAGELMVRLDAPEIKARLDQAEASLQQAEREWKRVSSLFNQQAATQADYDAADSRVLVAKGAVAEAKAMMTYVEILAPFDGVVTRKWADVGDQASPGKPLIALEDPSNLQLDADVPEAIATRISPEARMAIRIGDGTDDLVGTVTEIAPITDPVSRTLRVKLSVAGRPGMMSGQFARLLVPVGETASMLVPVSAVVKRGQMEIVFAVEKQHARLHLVKTGRQFKDTVEIISGLDSGDSVVVDQASQLVDGQSVTAP